MLLGTLLELPVFFRGLATEQTYMDSLEKTWKQNE